MILSVAVRHLKWTATINLSYQDILGEGSRINRLIIQSKSFRSDQTWTDNWSLDLYASLLSDESGRGCNSTSYRNFILFFWEKKYHNQIHQQWKISYFIDGHWSLEHIASCNGVLHACLFMQTRMPVISWFLAWMTEHMLRDFRVDKLWSR